MQMDRLKLKGISSPGDFYEVEDAQPSERGNFYFLSNDEIRVNFDKSLKNRHSITSIGVANPHYLHLLFELSYYANGIRVTAMDYNLSQLQHFKRLVDYIRISNSRIEFLENLFKIKFNDVAIRLLNEIRPSPKGYIRGSSFKDKYFRTENELWENTLFYKEEFISEYHLKDVIKTEAGLRIKTQTFGDINTYYSTILSASKEDYDNWPFTSAYGCGFLRSEVSFNVFKRFLAESEIFYIHDDLPRIAYDILMANRYKTIVFWISNLLIDYFIKKNPDLEQLKEKLFKLGTNREPHFPELDVVLVQDMREPIKTARQINPNKDRKRTLSIHTKTFSCIEKHIEGLNNIEITNMPVWFKRDNGISKLPNMRYKMANDFLSNDDFLYDTIFVHILVGHGMPYETYSDLLKKALNQCEILIILEHNKNSKDFKNIGLTIQDIRNALGRESTLEFCPGYKTKDRNLLFVYEGKLT